MKTIIIDLDGTILDNTKQLLDAMRAGYHALGIPYPGHREIFKNFGRPLSWFVGRLSLETKEEERFKKEFHRVAHMTKEVRLHREIEPLLEWIVGKQVAIVTSKSREQLTPIVAKFSLNKRVKVIVSSDDISSPKPSAEPLRHALELLGQSESGNACYIGDTLIDLETARNANMIGIGVGWSYTPELLKERCEEDDTMYFVQDGRQLVSHLQSMYR